jgi:hypothetical protein
MFIFPENRAVYEMMEKYGGALDSTDDNITLRMRVACWITTDTHSEYVILNAFPL